MVGPLLSSLDERIAHAGAGVVMTYRQQEKWLQKLRTEQFGNRQVSVVSHQADLDRFFRNVHVGLRGLRERIRRNSRSAFVVKRTVVDLSRWLAAVVANDQAPLTNECRLYLVCHFAEEAGDALRRWDEQPALRDTVRKAVVETELELALRAALAWVGAFSSEDAEPFREQTNRALAGVLAAATAYRN